MPVRAKSIYEPAEPDDGVRILTTNYWPRGISRERAGTYKRIVGPSRALLRAFKDGDIDWPEYERRYIAEMAGESQQREIGELAQLARAGNVTVMCVCKTDDQCHRRLLKALIEQRMEAP